MHIGHDHTAFLVLKVKVELQSQRSKMQSVGSWSSIENSLPKIFNYCRKA